MPIKCGWKVQSLRTLNKNVAYCDALLCYNNNVREKKYKQANSLNRKDTYNDV